jgi:hypothetical protein
MTAILTQAIAAKTTYTAQWFVLTTGVAQGSVVTMTEPYPGTYVATFGGGPANTYVLSIRDTSEPANFQEVGRTLYYWDGTQEITDVLLNTTISTRSSHNAAAVWAVGTRSITDRDGFTLSTAGINTIVAAVWASTARSLTTFGTLATDVWSATVRSITDKSGFDLSSAGVTSIWSETNRTITDKSGFVLSPASVTSIWAETNRSITGTVTTDASSRTASQNDLTFLTSLISGGRFTENALSLAPSSGGSSGLTSAQNDHLFAIPTNPLLSTNYVAPNNAGIVSLSSLVSGGAFTPAALINTPLGNNFNPAVDLIRVGFVGSTLVTSPADLKATGFATIDSVNSISTTVSGIPTLMSLVASGRFTAFALSLAPVSGGGSGGLTSAQNQSILNIEADSKLARQALINDQSVNLATATINTLNDTKTATRIIMRYTTDNGTPTITAATKRTIELI